MTEDETHLDLHRSVEEDVRSILAAMFGEPLCRVNVLLRLVYEEFMALDDADDVAEVAEDLLDIILSRAAHDIPLLKTMGSA